MTRMTFTRRETLALAGAAAAAWSLPTWAQEPKRGGTLVLGYPQTPRHLNGAVQSGVATALPSTQLFASPLRYDDQWQPQPYLAESWDFADDAKSLTLNLRKNAVFHDGKPITSADVAFSVMAIKENHPFQTMLAPVETVETPDEHTAIIRTSTPHPALLLVMSPALCPILPKHIYDDGQDLRSHPRNTKDVVGSGPFKFVEFTPAQRIVLERFDDYFLDSQPYLDRLIINLNPDISTQSLAFERGDIDMLPYVAEPTTLQRLSKNGNVNLTQKGYEGIGALTWCAFNCDREPLSDPAVRHAIAMSLDKNFIIKALQGGFGRISDSPIAPDSPFYAEDSIVSYPFDLDKANALLDEAGYKADGKKGRFSLTVDYLPNSSQTKTLAEYIRGQLRKLGITADVRASADFPSWAKRMAEHDFDMTTDVVFNWGDPVIGVARTYLSDNIKNVVWTNTQSYRNPKVDELLKSAAMEPNEEKRKADYAEFQALVTKDLPIEYINVAPYHTASSKKVGNAPTSIWGTLSPLDEVYVS